MSPLVGVPQTSMRTARDRLNTAAGSSSAPVYAIRRMMGKHLDKILKALEIRQRNTPDKRGYNKPGSMNKKKTGYARSGKR